VRSGERDILVSKTRSAGNGRVFVCVGTCSLNSNSRERGADKGEWGITLYSRPDPTGDITSGHDAAMPNVFASEHFEELSNMGTAITRFEAASSVTVAWCGLSCVRET
jgi:hypothetical protein